MWHTPAKGVFLFAITYRRAVGLACISQNQLENGTEAKPMRTMTIIALWALAQAILSPHYAYAMGADEPTEETLLAPLSEGIEFEDGTVQYSLPIPFAHSSPVDKPALAQGIVRTPTQGKTHRTVAAAAYTPKKARVYVAPHSRLVQVTAYSSTPDQTDSSPFITASGSHVHDGTVAANFLPFGTKVKFPDMYGDKVFTVEDRMAKRFSHRMDIWFPNRSSAIKFGVRTLRVEVVGSDA